MKCKMNYARLYPLDICLSHKRFTRLAINYIDVKYATQIYDYVILHVFLER